MVKSELIKRSPLRIFEQSIHGGLGKGEIGVYIQGNDDVTPWRFKIRAADFNNLQILPHILKGAKVADIMAILGSIDVIMGSVDR